MSCAPEERVPFEELLSGEAVAGEASVHSNSCSAVEVFLFFADQTGAALFNSFLPGEEHPTLELEEGFALLSFTQGCVASGNVLVVEDVFLQDDILYVHETLLQAEHGEEEGAFRPYNVTWLDPPDWDYPAEVTIDVELPTPGIEEDAR